MKAAVLYGPRDMRVEEVSRPSVDEGEVLIRPQVVSICGSDTNRYRGRQKVSFPRIIGHECSGQIVQLGEGVTDLVVGQRITIRPNFGCGNCVHCRMGRENLCRDRVSLGVTIDGCFAEYVKAPAKYVWPIDDNMSDDEGAVVEPLAVAVRALERMGNVFGRRVMILGAGAIGLFLLQLVKRAGATVLLADVLDERLTLGEKLGADHVVNAGRETVQQSAVSAIGGLGIDIVVETAGGAQTFAQALEIVKEGGRIVLVGLSPDTTHLSSNLIVYREIQIVGSVMYTYEDFSQAIQLLRGDRVEVAPLITHRFPLTDIKDAFDLADKGQGVKIMIDVTK